MVLRFLAVGVVALCSVLAIGQETQTPAKLQAHHPVVQDLTPVTAGEASAVLRKAGNIISKAFEHPVPTTFPFGAGTAPVTREQVVAAFMRQFDAISPEFKFTPNPVVFDSTVLKIAKPQRPSLERLIRFGCIGKVAPLATGPKDTLTVADFGDAVGFFMSRVAQLTYMPDPKWTPSLEGPNG